jgi:tetratricopeptide (TPR) repeat protein
MAAEIDRISNALGPLREVRLSLAEASRGLIPSGRERQRLVRRTRAAGNAVVPTLLRALQSTNDCEANWAYYLLGRLGGERVVRGLGRLLEDATVADEIKARALGLLSDLEAPVPDEVVLRDPDGMLARSVRELVGSLDSDEDVTQAAELILNQVPDVELPQFAAEVVRHGGRRAALLLQSLLGAPSLSPESRQALEPLLREASASKSERMITHSLERGMAFLEAGRPKAARAPLRRFVARRPDDSQGRSALGVCLLELGQNEEAIGHLEAAARIEPGEALHRWNLAAAAKQLDRLGGSYLALREYLRLSDDGEGNEERRNEARRFVRAYERMLRESHPGVPLSDVLRGEELFARAYAALTEGRPADAKRGFEEVLQLVPRHYPSWGNLGAAFLALELRDDAVRCLKHALELNPDYAAARQNLELLEQLQMN